MSTTAITAPPSDVVYMARRSELRLTKTARYPIRSAVTGERSGQNTPSEALGFRDGVLRVPKEGHLRMQDTLDGGVWEIDAEELHKWLENHRLYGDINDGFWRVDPTAPPISAAELKELQSAAIRLDKDKLREIIAVESEGWQREDVLSTARESLDQITALEAEAEREAAAKAKPGPKPKPATE